VIKKECHEGTVFVFKDDENDISIFGGGRMRGVKIFSNSIVLDVGADVNSKKLVEREPLSLIPALDKYTYERDNVGVIAIDISDGGVPDLPIEFWNILVAGLRREKRDVIACCVGGHGRTGLVLSILAYLMCNKAKTDPIKFVRDNYCENAVETYKQIEYIEKITGVVTSQVPSYLARGRVIGYSGYSNIGDMYGGSYLG